MLSEISPSQKDKYYMIPLISSIKITKSVEAESITVAARGLREGKMWNFCSVGIKFQLYKINNLVNNSVLHI